MDHLGVLMVLIFEQKIPSKELTSARFQAPVCLFLRLNPMQMNIASAIHFFFSPGALPTMDGFQYYKVMFILSFTPEKHYSSTAPNQKSREWVKKG